MVSRLLGKLEAMRQRTLGEDWASAGALTDATPDARPAWMKRRLFMGVPSGGWLAHHQRKHDASPTAASARLRARRGPHAGASTAAARPRAPRRRCPAAPRARFR